MAIKGLAEVAAEAQKRDGKSQSLWAVGWERLRRKKLAMGSLVVIILFYLSGTFAETIAPYSYSQQDLEHPFQTAWLFQPVCNVMSLIDPSRGPAPNGPTSTHILGTDRLGRDILSRILWGMHTSVIVSLAAILTGSIFLGVGLGAIAGFSGKWIDAVIMRIGELFMAFPGLLLVILISATIRPRVNEWVTAFQQGTGVKGLVESGFVDYFVVFGAMSVFSWVSVARLIRGQILLLRELDYVLAARAIGATTPRLIITHILPNTLNIIIIMLSGALGGAIGSELILSWLGVGIQPPTPSLGVMVYENGNLSLLIDQLACLKGPVFLAPILVVSAVFFCFALLGDGLNDALNPRAR